MKKRGRASIQEMIAPKPTVLDRVERPRPPYDLVDEEVEIFAAVVDARPADYFGPDSLPLLVQFCRHIVAARRLAELIERGNGDPEWRLKDRDRLMKMQTRESAAIAQLATKMRLCQQSSRTTRNNPRGGRSGSRPWE